MLRCTTFLLLLTVTQSAMAATIRVPQECKTIGAASTRPGPAIIVTDSPKPAHVFGDTVIAKKEKAVAIQIQGPSGIVDNNVINVIKTNEQHHD